MNEQEEHTFEEHTFYWPVDEDAPRRRVRAGQVPGDDHPRGNPEFVFSSRPALREAANAPSFWADAIDFYLPFVLVVVVLAYAAGAYFLGWPIPYLN